MDRAHIPGRVVISARAYERIAAAASAEALGIARREAGATIHDDRGRLRADVRAGVTIGPEPIVGRVAAARATIAARVTELTGATVSDVRVRLTHLISDDRRAS